MNTQQEIMSVCLAVVRGRISPEQARAAILARTSPEPLTESLRLDPAIVREAAQLARLPERDREECLELFKALYDSTPAEQVLEEDGVFGRMLVDQRVVPRSHVEECVAVQRRLHEAGCVPLPRLGELLLRQGFLLPGRGEQATTQRIPLPARPPDLPGRPLPEAVRRALGDPAEQFGRYVRVSLLGQGGAGEVWKSWDTILERWVALKFLKFEDTEELARLKREAQTAARLSYPNIAAVFEIAEANGRTFLVMEFIDGQTLATFPRNDHRKLVSLMREVAQAIQYAHEQGVVHRDIKPGNIMVDAQGRPYIMDFGLARPADTDRAPAESFVGTPSYMSPEQARGGPVDARTDVYALGATLYELLADRPPFRGRNAMETLDQVVAGEPPPLDRIAADLRTIVFTCLMKEPARRYARAADVADELRRWQDGEAIVAHPPSVVYRLGKAIAKRRAVLLVALAGLLVSGSVAGWAIPRWLRADRDQARTGRELAVEKEARASEARALALARPHLDEGRRTRSRLDRVLQAEDGTAEAVRRLAEDAHKDFDRALEIFPSYPDALLEKARIYLIEKDRVRALEFFTKTIEATGGYTTAYLSRARILLDQYEELRHAQGLRSGPESGEAAALGGRIREDLRRVDAGSKDTQELLFGSAALAILDGEYEKAARVFEEYARGSVSTYRGWEWAGHAWMHVPGMHDKAIRAFTESIKVRPRLASPRVSRGKAWLEAARAKADGATGQAMADFRRALELEPSNVEAHLGMGEALLRSGEPVQAMASFGRAVESNPGAPVARVARAWARLRTRDSEGALADAEEALRLGSQDPAALVVRARARCSSGDVGAAQADAEAVLARHPRYAPALVALGDVLRERGNPDRAAEEYGRAIALDPELAEAYHHRANAERDRGRFDAATADLTKAIALDASDPYAYFDRGVASGNRGDWRPAEEDFRRGLALHPTRPDWFWQRLWLARTKQGEAGPAVEELGAFVQARPEGTAGRLAPRMNDLLLGRLSEEDFLALLERTEYSRKAIAEGYYFAGEKALAEGRLERAAELFRRCLRTGARTTPGCSGAEIELRSLPGPK